MTSLRFSPPAFVVNTEAAVAAKLEAAVAEVKKVAPVLTFNEHDVAGTDREVPTEYPDDPPPAPWYRKVLDVVKGAVIFIASEGKVLLSLALVAVTGLLDQYNVFDLITYAKDFFGDGVKTGGVVAGVVVVYFGVKLMTKFVIGKSKTNARGVDEGE